MDAPIRTWNRDEQRLLRTALTVLAFNKVGAKLLPILNPADAEKVGPHLAVHLARAIPTDDAPRAVEQGVRGRLQEIGRHLPTLDLQFIPAFGPYHQHLAADLIANQIGVMGRDLTSWAARSGADQRLTISTACNPEDRPAAIAYDLLVRALEVSRTASTPTERMVVALARWPYRRTQSARPSRPELFAELDLREGAGNEVLDHLLERGLATPTALAAARTDASGAPHRYCLTEEGDALGAIAIAAVPNVPLVLADQARAPSRGAASLAE